MNNKYKKKRRESLFSILEKFLEKTAISQGLPIKYLPYIFLIFIFALLNVANTHFHHKLLRKVTIIESRLQDLKVCYTTLQASYMSSIKQSEIVKKAKELGLMENTRVPQYIH